MDYAHYPSIDTKNASLYEPSIPVDGNVACKKSFISPHIYTMNKALLSLSAIGICTETVPDGSAVCMAALLTGSLVSRVTKMIRDLSCKKRSELRTILLKECGDVEFFTKASNCTPALSLISGIRKVFLTQFDVELDEEYNYGSGFITNAGNDVLAVSNHHVLENFSGLVTKNEDFDVAAVPLSDCRVITNGEFASLPQFSVDRDISNDDVAGRKVAIVGKRRGVDYKISGKAIRLNTGVLSLLARKQRESAQSIEDMFCIVTNHTYVKTDGLSGSPVIDPASNKVIGIHHQYAVIPLVAGDGILTELAKDIHMFTGPEELRKTLLGI